LNFCFTLVFLLGLLTVLGMFFVPRSWNSIWMDREFSSWVAPVSNRISPTTKLYDEGLHMPMPPLPYVFMRVLGGGEANWIMESEWNFFFQSATLVLLFVAFYRLMGLDIACAAILATLPVFFTLPKAIVYDSMTQFLTALAGCIAVYLFMVLPVPADSSRPHRPARLPVLALSLGLVISALFLAKQSTAAGLVLGVVFLFTAFPSACPFRGRFLYLLLIGSSTVGAVLILSLALSPWMDIGNFYHDVLVIGSEPKGGGPRLLGSLVNFSFHMLAILFYFWVPVIFFGAFFRPLREALVKCLVGPGLDTDSSPSVYLTSILGVLAGLSAAFIIASHTSQLFSRGLYFGLVCDAALAVSLGAVLAAVVTAFSRYKFPIAFHPGTAFVAVFIFADLFHNLSVTMFRWHYDNNPFIAACFAVFFSVFFSVMKACLNAPRYKKYTGFVVFMLTATLCMMMVRQVREALECTEPWPEVPYLAGVKMRPEADGFRQLVQVAKNNTTPDNQILILPNDPNFQAFFDRPAPALSCAMIFSDQYWDRYVDSDYTLLSANPPRLIIVGPRLDWRGFSENWHKHWGAERLIDKISDELLPQKYKLLCSQAIHRNGKMDYMDVYILR